ncbi:MAG: phage integrase central domain-containing protein [Propionibacteriaceae bacterium]
MASIEKRIRNGQVRWYMRYRDPAGLQRTKTFDRKVDAERFLTTVASAKLTGSYIDPAGSRLAVETWAHRWLDSQTHLKPSTRERYAGILREHVLPRWGTTQLANVSHSAVQTWISEVSASRSAATTREVHRVLSLILSMAVKDDGLVRNPAAGISLPRVNSAERMYLFPSSGARARQCLRIPTAGCALPRLHGRALRRDGNAACRAIGSGPSTGDDR